MADTPTFEIANMGPSFPAEKRPEKFDNAKEACPYCGAKNFAKRLTPRDKVVYYSCCSETIRFKCLFCGKTYHKTFGGIRILRGEEAVRKRPQMYLDCDNEKYRKIAEEEMAKRNK